MVVSRSRPLRVGEAAVGREPAWATRLLGMLTHLTLDRQCPSVRAHLNGAAAIPRLSREHIPPAALDFHCSSVCHDVIAQASDEEREQAWAIVCSGHRGVSAAELEESLQQAMWRFSSSVSTRVVAFDCSGDVEQGPPSDATARCSSSLEKLWALFSPAVLRWQRAYISRRLPVS